MVVHFWVLEVRFRGFGRDFCRVVSGLFLVRAAVRLTRVRPQEDFVVLII